MEGQPTENFLQRVSELRLMKESWFQKYQSISTADTPRYSANGEEIVKRRPDGYLYLEEEYMRTELDRLFPGWSWEMAAPIQIIAMEWILAQGTLTIVDEYLIPFGINPPVRRFFGADATRIQFQRDSTHSADTIVDVGNNVKGANGKAFKVAVNRLCRIGDDIYGKQIETEGGGTLSEILASKPSLVLFSKWLREEVRIPFGQAFQILGVEGLEEIEDIGQAIKTILDARKSKKR